MSWKINFLHFIANLLDAQVLISPAKLGDLNIGGNNYRAGRSFQYTDGKNTINVNGSNISVSGNNITVENNQIKVGNRVVYTDLQAGEDVHITFTGELASLNCHEATINGDVRGDVKAHQLKCGDVGGGVKGHQIECGKVTGNVSGHSVRTR